MVVRYVPDAGLAALVWLEKSLHPSMEAVDLFKLLFQSEMGADHLLRARTDAVVDCLWREWDGIGEAGRAAGPVIQPLSPASPVARLHLAPLKARGMPFEAVAGLVVSQRPLKGTFQGLASLIRSVAGLASEGGVPFDAGEVASIEPSTEAPHHSPSYGPAHYRVLNDASAAADALARLVSVPLPGQAPGPPAGVAARPGPR